MLRFPRYVGTSPGFWVNLQTAYDLEEVQPKLGKNLNDIKPQEPIAA